MHRTRGKVLGVAVAIAASGLLAACGGNDSTASSTPTLTSTTTAAAAPSSAAPSEAPSSTEPSSAAPAPSSELERPQPVPNEPAPADTSKLTDKDKKFLDGLKSEGIVPSTPDIALSIGTYVCQGVAAGATEADMTTFVNAMAGSDPSFDSSKMSVEDAGKKYISTAKSTYCQ
ncbi:DUF732 domain-containing protein [Nocardia sp. NPDC051832]|uniref:DUF732 domain-containing protein n=1 Tax=Nocardia sp. NPDC051832 TaxID=3155673 RepID=UPI0034425DCF